MLRKRIVIASKLNIIDLDDEDEVCKFCGKKRATLQVLGVEGCCEEGRVYARRKIFGARKV